MGIITYNNISSEDLGLIVQFIPSYKFPEKEYENIHIPGKNGDLLLDKGSYKNVERTYSLAKVFRPGQNFIVSANKIASWLHSASGYARLEDSYEPEYYRLAVYKNDGEMYNYFDQATTIEVTFECKPQRWLKSGEEFKDIQNGSKLYNPTTFESYPVITFSTIPNQKSVISINDVTIELDALQDATEITIDCENMECYSNNTFYNSKLKLVNNKFPELKPEYNTITYSNVNNFKIQPRWWTL